MDFLCGAPTDPNQGQNTATAGVNIKTEPSQIILSPPITPPESMATDDDCTSPLTLADYLSKVTPQQDQTMFPFQPKVQVKQEAGVCNPGQSCAATQSQNTTTQYLLNLLQGQKSQHAPPAMHTKSLEQLLQEPSILAPSSQPCAVTVQQPTQVQQPPVVTQQVSYITLVKRQPYFSKIKLLILHRKIECCSVFMQIF